MAVANIRVPYTITGAILLGSSVKEILKIKKRLYDELALQNRDSNKPYEIGFSIGFSCYDFEHPKSIEELIHISDQKMYKNKKG